MPQSRPQHVSAIAHHEDDIGPDPLNDVRPTDAVVIENRKIKIFDAGTGEGSHVCKCCFKPLTGQFPRCDRGVEADHADLMPNGKGHTPGAVTGTVAISMGNAPLSAPDASRWRLPPSGWNFVACGWSPEKMA